MSVNAVNPVSVETPKKKGSSVAAPTIGLGVIGAGAGYLAGGKRPTLDEVFAMEPDRFESIVKDAKDDVKKEADKIKEEIDMLNSKDEEFVPDKAKKEAFENEVNKQKLADDAAETKALNTANENYDKKLLEELNKGKKDEEKFAKTADAPDDARNAAKEALKDSEEAKAVKTAENNVFSAKERLVRESADENIKKVVIEFDDAVKTAAEKKKSKITELAGDEEMKNAFAKIKKLFPKEGKGRAALLWGGIAAAVGLVAGLVLGGSKKEA